MTGFNDTTAYNDAIKLDTIEAETRELSLRVEGCTLDKVYFPRRVSEVKRKSAGRSSLVPLYQKSGDTASVAEILETEECTPAPPDIMQHLTMVVNGVIIETNFQQINEKTDLMSQLLEFVSKLHAASEEVDVRLMRFSNDGKVQVAGERLEAAEVDELCNVAQLMLISSIRDQVCNKEFFHLVEQPILVEIETLKDECLNDESIQTYE